MLINPNLLESYSVGEYRKKNETSEIWGAFKVVLPSGLRNDEEYTFSFSAKKLNEIAKKGISLVVSNMRNTTDTLVKPLINANKRVSVTFRYKEGITEQICLYPGEFKKANGGDATFYEMKLEDGIVATLHIPNKNDLETAKRQYFIGGGVRSKRYSQSLKLPKQSSYRKEVAA